MNVPQAFLDRQTLTQFVSARKVVCHVRGKYVYWVIYCPLRGNTVMAGKCTFDCCFHLGDTDDGEYVFCLTDISWKLKGSSPKRGLGEKLKDD